MTNLCEICNAELVKEISNGGIEVFFCKACEMRLETHFTLSIEDLGITQNFAKAKVRVLLDDDKKTRKEILRLLRKLFLVARETSISELSRNTDKHWETGVLPFPYAMEIKTEADRLGLIVEIEIVNP